MVGVTAAARVTEILYVFVVEPSWAVTTTGIVFEPTLKFTVAGLPLVAALPFTVIVAFA